MNPSVARPQTIHPKSHTFLAAVLTVLFLAKIEVVAADLYWDGGTGDIATAGNGASAGGGGTWNTTLLNWDAGVSPHAAWNNANNDNAVFAGTAGTVTLGSVVTAGGLQFSVAGYTITGSTLTLGTGASVSVTGDATISSVLAGSSGLTKTGSGRLGLTATNTYSGATAVTAGFIDFTNISLAGFGGGSGRNISVSPGAAVRRNAIDNAFLNRLVETTDEITVMTASTANNVDFSSSTGAQPTQRLPRQLGQHRRKDGIQRQTHSRERCLPSRWQGQQWFAGNRRHQPAHWNAWTDRREHRSQWHPRDARQCQRFHRRNGDQYRRETHPR